MIRRCLQQLDLDLLDRLLRASMRLSTTVTGGRRVIAFDGKTLRGARDVAGHLTQLLAGLSQQVGTVVTQRAVGAKTNQSPMLLELLDTLDITDAIITADALHCQRKTARGVVARTGHYILSVNANQSTVRNQLKALPSGKIRVLDQTSEHSHGRWETRTLMATDIPAGVGFPHACQVFQFTRTTRQSRSGAVHTEVVYEVPPLSVAEGSPVQPAI